MKNQLNSVFKWIVGGGVLCVFLILPELWISKLITQNKSGTFETFFTTMFFLTICAYIAISTIKLVRYQKWSKQYNQEIFEKAKKKLNSKFVTVLLNNPNDICEENFDCQAKVDNDGKIVCKVCVDFETKFDNYEEFLKYFHFSEE